MDGAMARKRRKSEEIVANPHVCSGQGSCGSSANGWVGNFEPARPKLQAHSAAARTAALVSHPGDAAQAVLYPLEGDVAGSL